MLRKTRLSTIPKLLVPDTDPVLRRAVDDLVNIHKCHTVILYGSRARGEGTPTSDYDLLGIRKAGRKYRYAKKSGTTYLDVFIFPEKGLRKVGDEHLYMKDAKVLLQKGSVGDIFVRKLKQALKKPYQPLPADELSIRKVWPYKMLERIRVGDIEGKYRRSWLHETLLGDYFSLRKKRYWGSKESFLWLKKNDPTTYKLFNRVLNTPDDLNLLKKLIDRVTQS